MKNILLLCSLNALLLISKIGAAQCASSNSVSTSNLVFDMPFTNGSGTDMSGNNLNATLVLTTPINNRNNISNQAVSLSGSFNSGGTVAHSSLLDFTDKITIATWIKVNNYTGVKRIVDKINGSVTGNFLLDMNNATLRFFVASGSVQHALTGIPANTWFHVAATYDGTVTSIYVNGILKNSTSAVTGNLVVNTSPLKIGLDQTGANPFSGGIDDIKIYGRSLSSTEVMDLYQTPEFDIQPPSVVNMCNYNTIITGRAVSTGTLSYKWKKAGAYINNNSVYSGATTNTLVITNGGVAETGVYELEAFSPNCISALSRTISVNTASLTNLNNTGLILEYPFNNVLGSDVSGNNLHANLIGSFNTSSDQNNAPNSAVLLGGNYASTPHNSIMNVSNQLSLACWFNASIISSSSSIAHRLIDKFNGSTSGNFVLDINANYIRFFCGSGSATSTSSVNINNWYHVAATYDGTDIKIYINGVLDKTVPYTGSLTPNSSPFLVGKNQLNSSDFYGSISNVKFYSRAISQQEIANLMLAPDVIVTPSSQNLCAGQNATFTAYSSGTDITWKKNGVLLSNGGNISGANSNTLSISNLGVADYDVYSCAVGNSNCTESTAQTFTLNQRNNVTVSNANLISYYAFNNTIGTDYSGNNLSLPFTSGLTSVADKDNNSNKALNFNGTNSYAYLNSSPLMYSNGSNTTFAMWLKPTSSSNQRIIEKNGSYYVDINAGVYRFILNTGNVFNTTITPAANVWQHIAFTYDGTNVMKFYLNGVLTNTLAAGAFSVAQNTNPFYIGCTNGFSLRYSGVMDEIKFYKRTLSDQEIFALYSSASIQQQIVSAFSCNSGSALLDATAFSTEPVSYQWYLNGNALSGQTSPTLSIPSLNNSNIGSYVCNYSNACATIPSDTADIQLLASSTISVAVNPTVSCTGMPVTLTASSPVSSSYVWSNASGPLNFTSVFTPTMGPVGTIYSFSLSVTSGTCSVQNVTTLTVSACTGIEEELTSESVIIYPNPTSDFITVHLKNDNQSSIAIYNVEGELVKSQDLSGGSNEISLLNLRNGIYFVTVTKENGRNTFKIIKQ